MPLSTLDFGLGNHHKFDILCEQIQTSMLPTTNIHSIRT